MYLVDTNIWLERFLDQEKSEEVGHFLASTPSEELFITDFAFHSIGVVMIKLDRADASIRFVQDAFIHASVTLLHLEPEDASSLVQAAKEFNLDFDDAYQYIAAEKYRLTIVSFDKDFDRTKHGRVTPAHRLAKGVQ